MVLYSFMSGFSKHCELNIASGLCEFASVCEFLSATAFVSALVPQLHKNSYLKSVEGLSILWVSALFTATLLNCFYFFEIKQNIYLKIITIVCCVTVFGILLQFWMYSKQNINFKMTFCGCCFVLWGALITIELAVPKPHAAYKLEWVSIILFSIDLMPQIMLNIMYRSTLSQSNIAVVLATFAKTLSFISVQLQVTSVELRVMSYISVFVAHINCFQLLWYRRPLPRKKKPKSYGSDSSQISLTNNSEDYELRNENKEVFAAERGAIIEGEPVNQGVVPYVTLGKEVYFPSYIWRVKKMTCWQMCSCLYVFVVMVSLSVIACIVIQSGWLVVAPVVILFGTFFTFLYRDHQEGRFSCCHNTCEHVRGKLLGESRL